MSSSEILDEQLLSASQTITSKGLKIDAELLQFGAMVFDSLFIIFAGMMTDHLVIGRHDFFSECTVIAIVSAMIFVASVALRKGYTIEAMVSPNLLVSIRN